MTSDEAPAEQLAIRRAIEDVRQAYRRAAQSIERYDDDAAFAIATELLDSLDDLVGDAAKLRARIAVRIRDARSLSLAGLATTIGVSRPRAAQFVRAAKEDETDEEVS